MDSMGFVIIAVGAFILQLFLCFKVKNVFIRIFPTLVAFGFTVYFFIGMYVTTGWAVLGNLLLLILSGISLGLCLFAWVIYGVYKFFKNHVG